MKSLLDNLTPRALRLLADAADIAAEHESDAISCDHILAALIRMDKGGAGFVLTKYGVKEEMLREFLSGFPPKKPKPTLADIPGPLLRNTHYL